MTKESIMRNNIFGVDRSETAIKCARLMLLNKAFGILNHENYNCSSFDEFVKNIKCGDTLIDSKEVAGDKAFVWKDEFGPVGFDIIIGNPPWGADIDEYSSWLRRRYPCSTKIYTDTYKIFIDKSISLLNEGGYLGFVVPNSFLFQPGYKDIKDLMAGFMYTVINLGEKIFAKAQIPVAVLLLKKKPSNKRSKPPIMDFRNVKRDELPDRLLRTIVNIDNEKGDTRRKLPRQKPVFVVEDVFSLRDAGIQYASVGAGKKGKGKGDLPQRLFSNKRDNTYTIPIYKGVNIRKEGWNINHRVNTWFRKNPESILNKNEWVRYGNDVFQAKEKIVWRQTSEKIRAALMDFEGYFGKSIQAAVVRQQFQEKVDINYALAVFNSSCINYLYQLKINEKYRIFPQVKLEYLKSLPFIIASQPIQDEIAGLVRELRQIYSRVEDKQMVCFFNLLPKQSQLSSPTLGQLLEGKKDTIKGKKIYQGKIKKLRQVYVEERGKNLCLFTADSENKRLLLFEINFEDPSEYYLKKYLKYYLENVSMNTLQEVNKKAGNVVDKLLYVDIVGVYDTNLVKDTVNRWEILKSDIDKSFKRIEKIEAKINEKINHIYNATLGNIY